MRRTLALLLTFSAAVPAAWGWWETGHRTVARIAASRLTPAARTRVARILGVADTAEAVTEAMADASTWADQVKSQNGTSNWHFIDLAIQDRRTDIPERCPEDNCVTARIHLFTGQLKEHPADPRWSELDALRYLIHFVGDVHQPLHAASDADLGGNCEELSEPYQQSKNLHALWDGGIIEGIGLGDRALARQLEASANALGKHDLRRWSGGDETEWAWESHELALRDIYERLHVPVEQPAFPSSCANAPAEIAKFKLSVTSSYVDAMEPVVKHQLMKAGLRLAALLNETL